MDVNAVVGSTPVPSSTTSALDLRELVRRYWMALGVGDPNLALTLSEQTLRRLPTFSTNEEETPARAILAANELLDDRLAAALRVPRPSSALLAARAALLSGAVPDWPAMLFAPPSAAEIALERLRAAIPQPTPIPCPAPMPTQRLDPIWKRS